MRYIGNIGEEAAVKLLKKKKYKILERNFTIRGGEIDIIAEDKDFLVFVEVKLRKSDAFGRPSEYVDFYKREHLKKAALTYMQKNAYEGNCRFDVVEIIGEVNDAGKLKIKEENLIKNAF